LCVLLFIYVNFLVNKLSDHEWKHNFVLRCLSPILEALSSAVEPEYETAISLDRTIRDFYVPGFLDIFKCEGFMTTRSVIMQRAVVSTTRETGKNLPLPGCLPQ
jgi:hypothetical protein